MKTEQQKLLLQTLLVCWQSKAAAHEVLLFDRKEMTLKKYIESTFKKCGYKLQIEKNK